MAKILVVDDEPVLLATLRPLLEKGGHEVRIATQGEVALNLAREDPPDLVILDVLLPTMSGLEVCRALRQESSIPVLMLTALGDELDKVCGLESGADDYLTKPFGAWELLARVKAMLRRAGMSYHLDERGHPVGPERIASHLREGGLEIDLISRRASFGGLPLKLKPREFDLLAFLMHHKGHAFSQDQLLREVWGYDDPTDTRTVVVHVRWLREKLEVDPSRPRWIETVKGVGYRFSPPTP